MGLSGEELILKRLKLVVVMLATVEVILTVPLAVKLTSYLQHVLQYGRPGSVADTIPYRIAVGLGVFSLLELVLLFLLVKVGILPRLIGVIGALVTTGLVGGAVAVLLIPRS